MHPAGSGTSADLPDQIDPRGLLTFGVTGAALLIIGRLITSSGTLPHGLGLLAYAQAILLTVLYLGRLIILTPTHPVIVIPALLSGFVGRPRLVHLAWPCAAPFMRRPDDAHLRSDFHRPATGPGVRVRYDAGKLARLAPVIPSRERGLGHASRLSKSAPLSRTSPRSGSVC